MSQSTSKLDKISGDWTKDLYDLIDKDQSPLEHGCNYVEPDNISCLNIQSSDLVTLHLNIHSLPSKLNELKNLISILNGKGVDIDVILLCEVFLNEVNSDSCHIDGYKLFVQHRKNKSRGGVAIFVKDNYKSKHRACLTIFEEGILETCFIEVQSKTKKYIVGEVYRVPGTSEIDFLNKYESLIKKLNNLLIALLLERIKIWTLLN